MTELKPLDFVLVRDMGVNDEPFIFHSWLRSFKKSPANIYVGDEVYYKGQHKIIEDTISSVNVKVAYHAEDTAHILAYIAYEYFEHTTALIHYCFVKKDYRRVGIGRMLYELVAKDVPKVFYTHTNSLFEKFKPKNIAIYDPYKTIGVRI